MLVVIAILHVITYLNTSAQNGWERRVSGVLKDYTDVYFISPLEGWIVGHTGTILHTSDGGASWGIQSGSTAAFLQGIWFLSDSSGWIVATSGVMLYTHNKGQKWTSVSSPFPTDYMKVMFCDQFHGWVVGDIGLILRTSDGGATWQFQDAGVQDPIVSVSFTDPNNGWVAGTYSNGWLAHTTNGGEDWVEDTQPLDHNTSSVFFISPYRGWVGTFGSVLFTDDVGETFEERFLPGPASYTIDLCFINDNVGWALTEKQVYYTANAGQTWDIQLEASGNERFAAIHFADPYHGCVVGSNGLIYTTSDGGGTGIRDTDVSHRIRLYPNPSNGEITIQLTDASLKAGTWLIEIFDMGGHLLYRESADLTNELKTRLGDFRGTATLRISSKGMSGSRVFIIP